MGRRPIERPPLTEDQRSLAAEYVPLANRRADLFGDRFPRHRGEFRSAAYLALTQAARSYRPGSGVKFSTFACYRIIGELKNVVRDHRSHGYRYHHRESRQPRVISLGIHPEWDFPDADGTSGPCDDRVEQLFRRIPPRHAMICRLHDIEGMKLDDVADRVGVSPSWVKTLHAEAMRLMRAEARNLVDA